MSSELCDHAVRYRVHENERKGTHHFPRLWRALRSDEWPPSSSSSIGWRELSTAVGPPMVKSRVLPSGEACESGAADSPSGDAPRGGLNPCGPSSSD
ncbi:hypothetical protein CEXT_56761 [Caerostris extrusa]|uniref:Uncharacterized protein n=1 Tax=Caerostris extrusa TaxID=172846 RepID=A0AAV4TQH0_CAEEX|nr:hypothetical protein CEXT_56761 [Caerostris extrusa]